MKISDNTREQLTISGKQLCEAHAFLWTQYWNIENKQNHIITNGCVMKFFPSGPSAHPMAMNVSTPTFL